jgi:hypothetical protein
LKQDRPAQLVMAGTFMFSGFPEAPYLVTGFSTQYERATEEE